MRTAEKKIKVTLAVTKKACQIVKIKEIVMSTQLLLNEMANHHDLIFTLRGLFFD